MVNIYIRKYICKFIIVKLYLNLINFNTIISKGDKLDNTYQKINSYVFNLYSYNVYLLLLLTTFNIIQ